VNAIDTTGAGDLYAAGFLSEYLDEKPLKQCAFAGAFIAAQVVKRLGAELPSEIWEEIRADLAEEDEAFDEPKGVVFVK
jgi:sugar/nucleoside kinase (ribokinase family)